MADLIQWPETAKVDRVIPKNRLYAEASASAALKQRFVDEIQGVRWAYKLGEESLRLAPGETVTEIQVFILSQTLLEHCVTGRVPFLSFFEMTLKVLLTKEPVYLIRISVHILRPNGVHFNHVFTYTQLQYVAYS